jgi:hypothetical protein
LFRRRDSCLAVGGTVSRHRDLALLGGGIGANPDRRPEISGLMQIATQSEFSAISNVIDITH